MSAFSNFAGLTYPSFYPPSGQSGASSAPAPGGFTLVETVDPVFLKVEDKVFEVHKPFLIENSPVFRDMFSLPRNPSTTPTDDASAVEGSSKEHPIVLPDVTAPEFESILEILRAPQLHAFFQAPAFSQAQWMAIFSLSHRYDMTTAFTHAIEALYRTPRPDDVIHLLSLAERYDIEAKHLIPCLQSIVKRAQPLSEAEMKQVSSTMIWRIGLARERIAREEGAGKVSIFPVLYDTTFDDSLRIVREVWSIK